MLNQNEKALEYIDWLKEGLISNISVVYHTQH